MAEIDALALDGVSCTFISRDAPGQRYTAVADVALRVGASEFVSVVGPTGCGKSTLLNLGAGLLTPSTGSVRAFGQPLAGTRSCPGSPGDSNPRPASGRCHPTEQ